MAHDRRAQRHRAGVGDPLQEARVRRHAERPRRRPAVVRGEHAHGLAVEAGQSSLEHPLLRVLRGARRHEHERIVARRKLHVAERLLPHQGPRDAHEGVRPRTRVLELRKRADECQ